MFQAGETTSTDGADMRSRLISSDLKRFFGNRLGGPAVGGNRRSTTLGRRVCNHEMVFYAVSVYVSKQGGSMVRRFGDSVEMGFSLIGLEKLVPFNKYMEGWFLETWIGWKKVS